jgi:hypothetical protein
MQFQVPQFIEVEDKIFGPLTLKQFLYLAGGGAAIFLLYIALPFFLFVIAAAPIGGLAAALAFYKINNQPFIKIMENAIRHYTGPKIYIWKKAEKRMPQPQKIKQKSEQPVVPALTKNKLNELAWSLDIKRKDESND